MAEPFETTVDHLIDKVMRPLHLCDSCGEPLPDTEVPPFKRHKITDLKTASNATGWNYALVGKGRALDVSSHVSRQVKADIWRRKDARFNPYRCYHRNYRSAAGAVRAVEPPALSQEARSCCSVPTKKR